MFSVKSLASVLAISGLSSAAVMHKRADGITLYAYGSDIMANSIYYKNGLAFFGHGNTTQDGQTVITFKTTDDTSVPWTIVPTSPSVTFPEPPALYINPSEGSFQQVGFAPNSNVPIGGVTSGFRFFGKSVAYESTSTDIQLQFYGKATEADGVFALYWNANITGSNPDAFPVQVKSTPPNVPATAIGASMPIAKPKGSA
ncbi:hypothetical protein HYALB_00002070 [Hymenoscyphus albidus]|uniref:Uncharacterized protein n=1 Tax=Hymenoscyphus albidus TaxID=595503 RepID=A0A9N9LF85_9HELO|nr:hypothetical protein HYALB_00002070 [Hymenoscyphus albidus]